MKKNFLITLIFYMAFLVNSQLSVEEKMVINKDLKELNGSLKNCLPSGQTNKPGCAFCDIITGKKEQGKIIAQNDLAMAIQKNIPARKPVDFLIIPKRYIENLKFMDFNKEEDQKILIDMFKLLQELWQQGSIINNNSGDFSLQINNGPCPVGSISHLHMKVQSPDNTWWK